MKSDRELHTCPSCGSEKLELCRTNKNACWVQCCRCDTRTGAHKTRQGAIAKWNARTDNQAVALFVFDDEKNDD